MCTVENSLETVRRRWKSCTMLDNVQNNFKLTSLIFAVFDFDFVVLNAVFKLIRFYINLRVKANHRSKISKIGKLVQLSPKLYGNRFMIQETEIW
jgi:hypothetical protein